MSNNHHRILYLHVNQLIVVYVSGLFVDVGNNYSVLENNNISFVYDDIDARRPLANMDLSGEMVNDLVGLGFPGSPFFYMGVVPL